MVFRLKTLLILILMCGSANSFAQELQGLWEKTKEYYKGFSVNKHQILLARQDSIAQQIKYKPQVQAQFQQSISSVNGSMGSFMPLTGIVNMSGSNEFIESSSIFNHFISGTLKWDLITFDRKRLDKAISSSKITHSILQEQEFTFRIQQLLAQRYIEFLYLNVLNDWYVKHASRYASILEITKGLAHAGLVSGADTLLASASLKNVQSNLFKLKGKIVGSAELLREFTNQSEPNGANKGQFLKTIEDTTRKQNNHPLILMKVNEEKTLEFMQQKNSRDPFPRVLLLGGLTNRSSGVSSNGQANASYTGLYKDFANNYFVGVGVTWNLQDVFTSKSEKNLYRLKRQSNIFEQEIVQNQIHSGLEQL